MDLSIVTVGDELLAGDTVNTNAAWIASELADRGVVVERVLTVPDELEAIVTAVRTYHARYDGVIVTGGIGGTHDDITMDAVARALERDLTVHDSVRDHLTDKLEAFRASEPDLLEAYDLEFDIEAAASLPEGARPIVVDEAWAPGCVVDGVYVFAGIPDEMQAMFTSVAPEFTGDRVAETIFTPEPEGALHERLTTAADRFDVAIGSYPRTDHNPGRIRISGTDPSAVEEAKEWLEAAVQTVSIDQDERRSSQMR